MANSNRSAEKESFWRLAIEEHRRSGLTVRSFCEREGVSEASFYAWRKEIKKRDTNTAFAAGEDATNGGSQKLIPVDVVDVLSNCDSSSLPTVEVLTPSGFTLRVPQDIQPQRLGVLLKVVANCQEVASRRNGAEPC